METFPKQVENLFSCFSIITLTKGPIFIIAQFIRVRLVKKNLNAYPGIHMPHVCHLILLYRYRTAPHSLKNIAKSTQKFVHA